MKPSDWTEEQAQSLLEFLGRDDRPDGALQFHELRGFLFALVFAPRKVEVSEWVPIVFAGGSPDFLSADEGQSVLKLLMRMWNNLAELTTKDCTDLAWLLGGNPHDDEVWLQWANGFMTGWERVAPDWNPALPRLDAEIVRTFDTSLLMLQFFSAEVQAEGRAAETPKAFAEYAQACRERFLDAANVYKDVGTHIFREREGKNSDSSRKQSPSPEGVNVPIRAEKGPGRNDPCPCGSGKKYKKCCLH